MTFSTKIDLVWFSTSIFNGRSKYLDPSDTSSVTLVCVVACKNLVTHFYFDFHYQFRPNQLNCYNICTGRVCYGIIPCHRKGRLYLDYILSVYQIILRIFSNCICTVCNFNNKRHLRSWVNRINGADFLTM